MNSKFWVLTWGLGLAVDPGPPSLIRSLFSVFLSADVVLQLCVLCLHSLSSCMFPWRGLFSVCFFFFTHLYVYLRSAPPHFNSALPILQKEHLMHDFQSCLDSRSHFNLCLHSLQRCFPLSETLPCQKSVGHETCFTIWLWPWRAGWSFQNILELVALHPLLGADQEEGNKSEFFYRNGPENVPSGATNTP